MTQMSRILRLRQRGPGGQYGVAKWLSVHFFSRKNTSLSYCLLEAVNVKDVKDVKAAVVETAHQLSSPIELTN